MSATSELSILCAGDCGPTHGPADGFPLARYAEVVRPVFDRADVRFGNCERQYSARKEPTGLAAHGCQPPAMADIFDEFGFDVMTLANNHMYDFGPQALLDTRELLIGKGILTTGAGADLESARQPAIVTRNGISAGFLGYSSVTPPGGEAAPSKPGIATLRVTTAYECRGPHALPRVLTKPDPTDLAMIIDDIDRLRDQVQVVAVAFHWGVDWVPRVLSDYQVEVAHACIDAGADVILGHHPHVPKGIEVYRGKVIFYCLGSLCMTSPLGPMAEWREPAWQHGALRNCSDLDPRYPLMPYGAAASMSLLANVSASAAGVTRVSFTPIMFDQQYRPITLTGGSPEFDETVRYLEWASEDLDHTFTVMGDEVVVTP